MISLSSILSALFLILGSILVLYGFFTENDPMYSKTLGWNLNLIWGSVVFVCGMLFGIGHLISQKLNPQSLD